MTRSDGIAKGLPQRLGAALSRMRAEAGVSQAQVAEVLGIGQRVVSRLEWGDQRAHVDQVLLFEAACGKPPGYALRLAGLIVDPQTTEDAIAADVRLRGHWRDVVRESYRLAVARSGGSASPPARSATKPKRSR